MYETDPVACLPAMNYVHNRHCGLCCSPLSDLLSQVAFLNCCRLVNLAFGPSDFVLCHAEGIANLFRGMRVFRVACLPFECFPRHTEFRHAQLGLGKPDYSTLAKYKYIVCVYSIIFGVTYCLC